MRSTYVEDKELSQWDMRKPLLLYEVLTVPIYGIADHWVINMNELQHL